MPINICSAKEAGVGRKTNSKIAPLDNSGPLITVAVWTHKPFTPVLTCPQGSQGCQKIRIYILQIKLLSFCANIALKKHKLQKTIKIEKKCKKTLVF